MKPFLILKSVEQVLNMLKEAMPLAAEKVTLDNALGRYLAEPFIVPENLPGFDRSTVDGYAVRARDLFGATEASPALVKCIGKTVMGQVPEVEISEGDALEILTGGMMPKGADCAVMVEYSRPGKDGLLEIVRPQAPGDNVVYHDDDASAGTELIPAGRRLRPQEIGCLAAFGASEPFVTRLPKVAIISTGDEVVPINSSVNPGQIRDINSHSLAALCECSGAIVRKMGIVRDDFETLNKILVKTLEDSDVVVVSGGSSAGTRDHTIAAFSAIPHSTILAHGVAISPGKPFILARVENKWLLGLPGHVAGALICSRVFLMPLLQYLQGQKSTAPVATVAAKLSRSIASAQGRRDYIRCRLEKVETDILAIPVTAPSAIISGLVNAAGLVICPENREGLYAGENVSVELF